MEEEYSLFARIIVMVLILCIIVGGSRIIYSDLKNGLYWLKETFIDKSTESVKSGGYSELIKYYEERLKAKDEVIDVKDQIIYNQKLSINEQKQAINYKDANIKEKDAIIQQITKEKDALREHIFALTQYKIFTMNYFKNIDFLLRLPFLPNEQVCKVVDLVNFLKHQFAEEIRWFLDEIEKKSISFPTFNVQSDQEIFYPA